MRAVSKNHMQTKIASYKKAYDASAMYEREFNTPPNVHIVKNGEYELMAFEVPIFVAIPGRNPWSADTELSDNVTVWYDRESNTYECQDFHKLDERANTDDMSEQIDEYMQKHFPGSQPV